MDDKQIIRDLLDRNRIDWSTLGCDIRVGSVTFTFDGENKLNAVVDYLEWNDEDF